eukprot:scaffold4412_cov91-Cylindrotheca_fusiformis.AAC.7
MSPQQTRTPNQLGKQMVVPIGNGIYFCIVYCDMHKQTELELSITPDGLGIHKKKSLHIPTDAAELLSSYKWGNQRDHFVFRKVEECLDSLKTRMTESEKYDESVVIRFDQVMFPYFVDEYGNPTNRIEYDIDKGKITFFVRTTESIRTKGPTKLGSPHLKAQIASGSFDDNEKFYDTDSTETDFTESEQHAEHSAEKEDMKQLKMQVQMLLEKLSKMEM